MKTIKRFSVALMLAICLTVGVGAWAADSTDNVAAGGMQLPPGWTAEDMQAMMAAATPGEKHKYLTDQIGSWTCKTKSWMAPNTDPEESAGTTEVTPLMDGRYIKSEMKGEMPGMGPFNGLAIYGHDNVSQQYVSMWIDNFGTGMMNGTGEMSDDGKTLTWKFAGYCPLNKKPIVMRQIETTIDAKTKKLEMFGPNPKTGEEFKMMEIVLTKK